MDDKLNNSEKDSTQSPAISTAYHEERIIKTETSLGKSYRKKYQDKRIIEIPDPKDPTKTIKKTMYVYDRKKYKPNGGAREGAGRPPGTTTKLTGTEILKSIKKHSGGKKFEDLLAQGYMETIKSGDKTNRLQYERLILNKVVADKTELDLSGTGTALKTIFNFGHIELPEWNQDSVIDGQIRDITPPKLSGDDEQGE